MNLKGKEINFLPTASKIALSQYTSGSTSDPKGVMITHENILNNVQNTFKLEALGFLQSTAVSWLPLTHDTLTHDMGIIFALVRWYSRRALITNGFFATSPNLA
ncbi:AMP-binding protein [Coxiella-like endosymbiont]|uniref:AMP-binding protein n=1 Tax=Coxiella-like endosymbiont TaxID=1592897 RepID=UPI00272B58C5|nr:AMP-binding protein [Coxiella-like endosymbiont]